MARSVLELLFEPMSPPDGNPRTEFVDSQDTTQQIRLAVGNVFETLLESVKQQAVNLLRRSEVGQSLEREAERQRFAEIRSQAMPWIIGIGVIVLLLFLGARR